MDTFLFFFDFPIADTPIPDPILFFQSILIFFLFHIFIFFYLFSEFINIILFLRRKKSSMDSLLPSLVEGQEALANAFGVFFFAKCSALYASIYSCSIHYSISFNESSVPIKTLKYCKPPLDS